MAPLATSTEPNGTRRLTDLRSGETARLLAADLRGEDLELLNALGMSVQSPFKLCKAGDPWIVQVRGTRIGISDHVARLLRVELDADAAESTGAESAASG